MSDMSDYVIHFTRGDTDQAALDRLLTIIDDGHLRASSENIRGGHACICFSEAPLAAFAQDFIARTRGRYSPFGLMFPKQLVYPAGARPVIYQSDAEYDDLKDVTKWRHMRYEPPEIDFTWEREWRINQPRFALSPEESWMIVPDREWADRAAHQWLGARELEWYPYSQILEAEEIEQRIGSFPWRIAVLR
jgi:hypothetical protein